MKPLSFILILLLFQIPIFEDIALAHPNSHPLYSSCELVWRVVPIPNVGSLYQVKALAANDVWAVGNGDFLHWDGTMWNVVPKPVSGDVRGIVATATNDIWAFGFDEDSTFILHWDGAEWSLAFNPSEALMGVVAFSENDVWAMGIASQYYHWDGMNWNTSAYTSAVPSSTIFGMDGVASDDIWAVGYSGTTPATTPVILRWDGNVWSQNYSLPTSPYSYFSSIDTFSANDVWVVGGGIQVAAHWDGHSWTNVSVPSSYLKSVTAIALDDAYAVGDQIVHWDGTLWQVVAQPNAALNAVVANSATDVWAVGKKSFVTHGSAIASVRTISPKDGEELPQSNVTLKWRKQACAERYQLILRRDAPNGKRITRTKVTENEFITKLLTNGASTESPIKIGVF